MNKSADERPGIQSVETSAQILSALAQSGGVCSLGEIAQQSRMTKAKAHRYLVSLIRSGMVSQDMPGGRYRLGPLAITLGLTGLRTSDPIRIGIGYLPKLRDEIGETSCLAIWTDSGPTIVDFEDSPFPIQMTVRVGSVFPLLVSATGRLFTAFLPRRKTQPLIDQERKRGMTPGFERAKIPSEKEYESILGKIREQKYSYIRGTLLPSVNVITAPVFDHKNTIAFALVVVGPRTSLTTSRKSKSVKTLLSASRHLSHVLGHNKFRTAE